MLIVKQKDGQRVVAAEGTKEEMEEKFEELKGDTDFDSIDLIDRTGRLYKRQEVVKQAAKKSAKK